MLKKKEKISFLGARKMIFMFAMYGNHYQKINFSSEASVKKFFEYNGYHFDKLVESIRNFSEAVPYFENSVGPSWILLSENGSSQGSRIDKEGNEDLIIQEPGSITIQGYWSIFDEAIKLRDDAIKRLSMPALGSAFTLGIASIEGYFNYSAEIWNRKQKENCNKLFDSIEYRVSIEEKFEKWIPQISGKRFDKSKQNWMDFKHILSIRNDEIIHPKITGFATNYFDLVNKINKFRTGIAGILIELHILFSEIIPASIIRAKFYPEVYYE